MSKRRNTILFIIGGTVFNIVVTILCFALFLLLYSRFLFPHLPEGSTVWMLPVNFLVSITASFLVYRQAIKLLAKKVDMEKHFAPIFTRSRPTHRDS